MGPSQIPPKPPQPNVRIEHVFDIHWLPPHLHNPKTTDSDDAYKKVLEYAQRNQPKPPVNDFWDWARETGDWLNDKIHKWQDAYLPLGKGSVIEFDNSVQVTPLNPFDLFGKKIELMNLKEDDLKLHTDTPIMRQ